MSDWRLGGMSGRALADSCYFHRCVRGANIFTVLLLLFVAPGLAQRNTPTVLVLQHANLIDGVSPQPLLNATVMVRDGKIAAVGGTNGFEVPAGAKVLDLGGLWLLPGMIDVHTHIGTVSDARTALMSGVTTVRIMGVPNFVDVGLRELHRRGMADVPDVIACGYQVRPDMGEPFFLDFPDLFLLMPKFGGADNIRRVVRANLERGVSWLKILVTERAGTPDTDPQRRTFTDEELVAAVAEARSRGIAVAAHAHSDSGVAAAVRAGVRTVEHATYASDDTLRLIKAHHTYLVSTVSVLVEYEATRPGVASRVREMVPRARDMARRAVNVGVDMIPGTDGRYDPTTKLRLPLEIRELVATGMPPMRAIQAATSIAAASLNIGDRTGSVRPGMEADLIAVNGNPLDDTAVLENPVLIINDGRIVREPPKK